MRLPSSRAKSALQRTLHAASAGLRGNPFACFGALVIGLLVVAAVFAPFLTPYDPIALKLAEMDRPPDSDHWMGTDNLGRDVYTRVLYGARVSLTVGLIAQGVALSLGILLGLTAGFLRGWVDQAIMWLVNVMWAFPYLLLVLAIQIALGNEAKYVFLAIGLTAWVPVARIVRGEVLSLREREFVEAARALGLSSFRIMVRHILPNVTTTLIVMATLGLATAIIAEAALSFLGLGVQPPTPSWGRMIHDGVARIHDAWWQATFPSLAIMLSVLAFNLLGDAFSAPRTEI